MKGEGQFMLIDMDLYVLVSGNVAVVTTQKKANDGYFEYYF